jgi:23S rRNA (pseudouridine1915-N3)-methyltransferase
MKIHLIIIGQIDATWLNKGFNDYLNRISKYLPFQLILIEDIKNKANMPKLIIKNKEGELILKKIASNDIMILLDEKGSKLTSKGFADFIQNRINSSVRNIYFVIGGAYGFSQQVYERSNYMISLSDMTFSHQIVRLIFAEQLYRALTIINNEPYHHD